MQKGITPVVAVILLLLVTVSLVGFTFVYFQRLSATAGEKTQNRTETQSQQFGILLSMEGAEKNRITVRNAGSTPVALSALSFYVDDQRIEAAGPSMLDAGAIGDYYLDDSKLAMLPDPLKLRITAGSYSDSRTVCFYCKYYVGYWKLDEGTGNTAYDSSGSGIRGTVSGGDPAWVPGKYGAGLRFDGASNGAVDMGDVLDFGSDFTVEAWVRSEAAGQNQAIVSKIGGGANSEYNLYLHPINKAALDVYNAAGGQNLSAIGGPNIAGDNTFHHVAGVVINETAKLYVDGTLRVTASSAGNLPRQPDVPEPLKIGRTGIPAAFMPFKGTIDEVRFLKIARSMTTA